MRPRPGKKAPAPLPTPEELAVRMAPETLERTLTLGVINSLQFYLRVKDFLCPWLPNLNQRRPDFTNNLYNLLYGVLADLWSFYDGQTAITDDRSLTMAEIENRLFDVGEKSLLSKAEAEAIKKLIEPEIQNIKFDPELYKALPHSSAFKTWHEARVMNWAVREIGNASRLRSPSFAELQACVEGVRKQLEHSDDPATLLEQRRFRFDVSPPELRIIYSLAGTILSTPGNLTTFTAASKAGKSAAIGALMAAAMTNGQAKDLLGFSSSNPAGLALVHFDTEQATYDHWQHVNRAQQRAGVVEPPRWFYSYCLKGLGFRAAWACIKEAVRVAVDKHGGIHSILIDGVADLVLDVNDPAESNSFVTELEDMASPSAVRSATARLICSRNGPSRARSQRTAVRARTSMPRGIHPLMRRGGSSCALMEEDCGRMQPFDNLSSRWGAANRPTLRPLLPVHRHGFQRIPGGPASPRARRNRAVRWRR